MAINEKNGKPAITHYKVLERFERYTYMEFKLETGRTHQIRVHLSHIGCPICGDYLYGRELPELKDRFALHSARLRCIQPVTGETVNIVEPMPEAMEKLLCV